MSVDKGNNLSFAITDFLVDRAVSPLGKESCPKTLVFVPGESRLNKLEKDRSLFERLEVSRKELD